MIEPKPNIRELEPYTPGEQPTGDGVVKLNTNENPYLPPDSVVDAVRASAACLHLYPNPTSRELRERFAEVHGTTPDRVIVGNGSDDILAMVFRAYVGPGRRAAFPVPGYSLYKVLCNMYGGEPLPVEWPDDYSLPDALGASDAALTLLANPNSPTGTFVGPDALGRLAKRLNGVLLIDEAYADFARDNCLRLVEEHENVVIARTVSKSFSLAGLRVGFAVARPEIIETLDKVRDSYNVSCPAQAGAAAALRSMDEIREHIAAVRAERQRATEALQEMGLTVLPSESNFVMAFLRDAETASTVFESLKDRRIYVRHFPGARTGSALRVTIGTRKDMDALFAAMREILAGVERAGGAP